MGKIFNLKPSEIVIIAAGHGSCIATDRVTIDGAKVGFMYRDEPTDPMNSGWVFLAGDEDQDYLDDPTKIELYDVNTIVNYDRDVLPFLDAEVGSKFERNAAGSFGRFGDED